MRILSRREDGSQHRQDRKCEQCSAEGDQGFGDAGDLAARWAPSTQLVITWLNSVHVGGAGHCAIWFPARILRRS